MRTRNLMQLTGMRLEIKAKLVDRVLFSIKKREQNGGSFGPT